MDRLLIVGASGFGREVLALLKQLPQDKRPFLVGGFLDDASNVLGDRAYQERVVGTVKDYVPTKGDVLALAIGAPKTKLDVAKRLRDKGAHFATLIHPTAIVSSNARLGEGTILCAYSVVSCDAQLGDLVHVNFHTTIGHDAVVGEGSTLSSHCDLTGHVELGRGVFMGSGARITPNVKVGDFARVGAGSVVLTGVAEGVTVFGVPARIVR